MISFENVTKHYRHVQALTGVTFDVSPGDVFGYIGPNGAGKTTSIKILTGLIRDYEGTVRVNGKDVSGNRSDVQRSIGYVPQDAGFQEWRTVNHALETFARLSGVAPADRERRINAALERVGIEKERGRRIVHLSGGTVQKLRLAQAILHEPRILILDEPLSGLDPASRYQVKEIIRDLAGENRIIFFSSHILSDVENVAGRIGILHNGTVKKVGTPKELRDEYGLGMIVEIQLRDGAATDTSVFEKPVVQSVEQAENGTLRLTLDPERDLDESMNVILSAAAQHKVPVRSLRHLQPSLEDVYLSLTGDAR